MCSGVVIGYERILHSGSPLVSNFPRRTHSAAWICILFFCLLHIDIMVAPAATDVKNMSSADDSDDDFSDDSGWEFQQENTRQTFISDSSWKEYQSFRERTCRPELSAETDRAELTKDYLSWEEAKFHKSLLRLLSSSHSGREQTTEDLKLRSKLLVPEESNFCKHDVQNEVLQEEPETDRFEDVLLNRLFRSEELRSIEETEL